MASGTYEVEQEYGVVEDNILMIPQKTAEELAELMNQDLASLYILNHQYRKHQWLIEGPQFRELEQLFTMHAEQTAAAAVELGERINALGAIPAATLRKQLEVTYIEEEPDGAIAIRDMLTSDVTAEATIAQKLREHIRRATELEDWGTEDLLKSVLTAGEKRAAFVQKHLESESLDRGRVGSNPEEEKELPTLGPVA